MVEVLIVEDHPLVVEGLQNLLQDRKIASKAIAAYSVQECMRVLKSYSPTLILLDYQLPDGNGIDLCKAILQQLPTAKILAISSFKEQSLVRRMIDNGAMGYVLKNASEDEVIEAINSILAGNKYLCEETQQILNDKGDNNMIITRREMEVLRYISDGFTNPEIADKLFISTSTVDSHRKNLILKLNAKNTASLIKIAIQKGYCI
jgi:DNA-binding NarL/FixJ family response regulator